MPKKKRYATEEDILNANPAEVSKLNFGGNLYMRLDKKGYKYFQFRICLKGNDTTHPIGKHPDMTLTQARAIAEELQTEVEKTRKENGKVAFKAKLTEQKRGKIGSEYSRSNNIGEAGEFFRAPPKGKETVAKYTSFRTMEDLGQFLSNLSRCQGLITDEMLMAIYLLLLIPSQTSELLCAEWIDFNFQTAQWTIKQGRMNSSNNRSKNSHIVFLSKKTLSGLNILSNVTGTNKYLFPSLSSMKKSERDKEMTQAIQIAWPNYRVEPDGFRYFFKAMAIKHGYFAPQLIEAMMAHNAGNPLSYNYAIYVAQLHLLAEWWSYELYGLVMV